MRVALVEPNMKPLVGKDLRTVGLMFGDIMEPLGLCYIGAYLKQFGHQIKIFHQLDETNEQIIGKLEEFKPSLVGFSVFVTSYSNSLELAKMAKEKLGAWTVFGNVEPSVYPEMVKDDAIDFAVMGEGELTIKELIDCLESGETNYSKVDGIAYFDERVRVNNPRRRMTGEE
ncbi:unnamed protein product, partial [marine sediment metagenome]